MTVDAYPLHWPSRYPRTSPEDRRQARFHNGQKPLTVAVAMSRLRQEIDTYYTIAKPRRLDPDQVVVSSDIPLRNDGQPASGRRPPEDPGVAVYITLDGVPRVFPCDVWDREADNIAAIAAHLNAMRGIERWGVGGGTAHYTGFAALEHQPELKWYDVLGCDPDASAEIVKIAYNRARKAAHPDHGGTDEEFHQVQQAYTEWQNGGAE
ncbi:DnaJ domain-containing protein [Marinobacter salarius]|uniref:DnaJ domain-containing protein n=1 Tax=Marinobacter salarius TaxID=1420917 RepID=UPI003D100C43